MNHCLGGIKGDLSMAIFDLKSPLTPLFQRGEAHREAGGF